MLTLTFPGGETCPKSHSQDGPSFYSKSSLSPPPRMLSLLDSPNEGDSSMHLRIWDVCSAGPQDNISAETP